MAKIGVIHYNWPGFSFSDYLQYAAKIGCTHVELMSRDVWPEHDMDADLAELQAAAGRIRAEVESHGLKVSAFGANNDFAQADAASREKEVARMRRCCEIAKVLGEDTVIRSEGGAPKEEMDIDAQWDSMRDCFHQCIPFLEELGISLAVDNHGILTNEGERLIALLDEIDHPRVGSNLDTMNFRWFGNSIEACDSFYQRLAPRVLHAHMKDGFDSRENYKGAALGEGEIHLDVALNALKAAGFDGVYTAEYEGPELDGTGYRKCVDWIKANA